MAPPKCSEGFHPLVTCYLVPKLEPTEAAREADEKAPWRFRFWRALRPC